jgi:hypothetical protein
MVIEQEIQAFSKVCIIYGDRTRNSRAQNKTGNISFLQTFKYVSYLYIKYTNRCVFSGGKTCMEFLLNPN